MSISEKPALPDTTRMELAERLRHLESSTRAFLRHFDPCNLAEDKSQQWQALEHECDLASAALRQPIASDAGAVREALRSHWLTQIVCDHDAKTDRACCSCSEWRGPVVNSVGAAVESWIDHVLSTSAGAGTKVDQKETPLAMRDQG